MSQPKFQNNVQTIWREADEIVVPLSIVEASGTRMWMYISTLLPTMSSVFIPSSFFSVRFTIHYSSVNLSFFTLIEI